MEDGRIKDDQITQSSYYDYMSMGKHARLNILVGLGAWMAQGFASGERIQIDLNRLVIVTKVATQERYGLDRWITSFTISYSLDGTNWKVYQEGGVEKVFQVVGVTNRHQVVDTVLPLPIKTKLLRITTVTCKGYCALRMEVYDADAPALGMEDGRIKDDQITQSSFIDNMSMGKHARLYLVESQPATRGAWVPSYGSFGQWIQIDFQRLVIVTKVATQGRHGNDQWITSFTISYSLDGTNWSVYQEGGVDKVFVGVTDRHQVVDTVLPQPIKTKFLRITTVTCNGHCALRMEVYGYDAD
ncbi:predicted protein [Nematostella vectensis]|uniref:F5/8 type C domain-containing protein n=1 Tax=Nematostella vectensis TaxID=45351 RepID=A7SF85_NEMVE|nr:predicted protein [Nematostella vectensis]|eukprot:XP_001629725.1 predicted protein [Nematostella vectensis]